jgi:hypothetical protein
MRSLVPFSVLIVISAALVGCGGGGGKTPPPVVSITLSPHSSNVTAGQTQQFTATVSGSSNTSVSYALSGSGCTGAACGTISAAGIYTAPSPIPASATVTVVATAVADTTKTASSTITQVPVAVSITPSTQSLRGADTQQFTATITGYSDTSVTWTVTGSGTLDDSGLYAAPYAVPSQTTASVTATSKFDNTKSASATVTLTPLTIAISPGTSALYRAKTAQFTASIANHSNTAVNWSVSGDGSIDANGLYTAPNIIAQQETATITATSQADTSKSASSTVTLAPVSLAVAPSSTTLYIGQQMQFAATVQQSDDTGVDWALSGTNCSGDSCGTIDANGLYTAPSSVTPVKVTKLVSSSAGPWVSNGTINTNMPFGGGPNPPTLFNAADGLTMVPGSKVTVGYSSGMWCFDTYVSASTCRDANGWPEFPTTNALCGANSTYPPSKYMDPSAYPVALMYLSGAFADSNGTVVGKPFAIGNGPESVTVPDGATQLQLGANDCDYYTARDYFSPLQAQVSQSLVAVTITATSSVDPDKTATATVMVTDDPNAKLSGPYAFLFEGPGSSGAMTGMLGHFVADGNGKITGGVVDSNSLGGQPAIKTSFTGSFQIGTDDRGILTFDSLPGSPSFRFAVGDMQDKEYAVEIDSTNSHLAGYIRKQHLGHISPATFAGNFALGFYGFDGSPALYQFNTTVGKMTVDQAGTASAGQMDSTFTSASTFTGTLQLGADVDTGRGALTLVVPSEGTYNGTVLAIDANRILYLLKDQTGSNVPLMIGELRRQSGTFSTASLKGPAAFYYTGVTSADSTNTAVGVLGPGGPGLTGEFDSNNNGVVLTQQALTASATVDAGGRAVLGTSVLGQIIVYLIDDSTGYLLHSQSQGFGMIEKQSFPAGGLTLASLEGHKTCGGTPLPFPYSSGFSCTMTWDASGGWTSITDNTSLAFQNNIGMVNAGQIVLDASTGRYTNTMIGAPFHHVGYAVSANKLILIDSDPVASNQGVLWQAVGLWER